MKGIVRHIVNSATKRDAVKTSDLAREIEQRINIALQSLSVPNEENLKAVKSQLETILYRLK